MAPSVEALNLNHFSSWYLPALAATALFRDGHSIAPEAEIDLKGQEEWHQ
jgi:hypothetical protein